MKVGVLQFFSWSRRIPLATVYERALSRIEVMDRYARDRAIPLTLLGRGSDVRHSGGEGAHRLIVGDQSRVEVD